MDGTQGGLTAGLGVDPLHGTVIPRSNVFFLEQILGYDADKRTIIEKTIELYPLNLLTSNANLYVLIDIGRLRGPHTGGILATKTRNLVRYDTLDEFVRTVEAAGKGVVVSFGQEDFNRFSTAVEQRSLWRVHETYYKDKLYKVHKCGNPYGRRNGRERVKLTSF